MEVEREQVLKKPLTKTEQSIIDGLVIRNHPEVITNPFSGESFLLQPKAVALHDFIKGYEVLIHSGKTNNIRLFDSARSLFNKLYPNTYMGLLN